MKLPNVIAELVKAQNNFDSVTYANCFSDTAVVVDEGNIYKGRTEIQHWKAEGNQKYKPLMKPVAFTGTDTTSVLSTEISGTFDGSPVVLKFHFEIIDGRIQSLKITG